MKTENNSKNDYIIGWNDALIKAVKIIDNLEFIPDVKIDGVMFDKIDDKLKKAFMQMVTIIKYKLNEIRIDEK